MIWMQRYLVIWKLLKSSPNVILSQLKKRGLVF